MNCLEVRSPGLLTTVQDLGRPGFGPIGVSPSGAADPISLRLGNRLVGNPDGAAALEMTLVGGAFRFREDAVAALAGSDFGTTLDEAEVGAFASFFVRAGQTLRLAATRSGARCYLCVRGGFVVPLFLASASTHVLSGLGGFEGRPLREGDVLEIGRANEEFRERKIAPHFLTRLFRRDALRVTPGPQADWLTESTLRAFYAATYRVGEQSNRMGLRLEGARMEKTAASEMITEGVSLGAIQVPPEGSPIILFVEQQTTGGYPKIANVIAADLHRLGQLRPRDEIHFEEVTFEAARLLLAEQEQLLRSAELILE